MDSPASKVFADRLAKYSYFPEAGPSAPTTRRTRSAVEVKTPSPRSTPLKKRRIVETDDLDDRKIDIGTTPGIGGSKRSVKCEKGKQNPAKKPRGYADPAIYKHLRPTNDLLQEGLDIVFCGINPGKRSSMMGHHFAHPSNKFWRSLHQSGLTRRQLDPKEDETMPDEYGYGLTNLVDRPTSEQSELSTLEMKLNVFNLTTKFMTHRPRVVCFVGKKIWDVYEVVVAKTAVPSDATKLEALDHDQDQPEVDDSVKVKLEREVVPHIPVKLERLELSSSLTPPPDLSESGTKATPGADIKPDLVARPTSNATTPRKAGAKRKPPAEPFEYTQPRRYRLPLEDGTDTYFWVVPNTSGLERTQLPEQVVNFTALRLFLERLKSGWKPSRAEDGREWMDIVPTGAAETVDQIKRAAMAKPAK
ncbi:hypothetical protein IAU60_006071 [Kwoniella sp. DSM 27419]